MNVEIENPFELILELSYINAIVNQSKCPEMKNINKIIEQVSSYLKDKLKENSK